MTPVEFTVGYRETAARRVVSYAGVGVGWHTLKEESPSLQDAGNGSEGHLGYHILGGAEYPVGRWLWLAGEIQWASVPGVLGETGVSAVYGEDNLGGTTFRFKILVGR